MKKKDTRLIIDVDGVIYNFVDAFMDRYKYHGGEIPEDWAWDSWAAMNELPNDDIVNHIWNHDTDLFWCGSPYPDAVNALELLNDEYDVVIATAVPFIHVPSRANWMEEFAPFIHRKQQMVITSDKSLVRGDFLVEDHLPHVQKWLTVNGNFTAMCIDRPWNQDSPPWYYNRVPSLRYVAELLGVWHE